MLLKKYFISTLSLLTCLSFFIPDKAYAANGVTGSVESIFFPIGKTDNNDTRGITLMYGIKGFSELHENIRILYGVSGSYYNGFIFSVPVSIAYVPTADYKFNLRPQIFVGVEPFYSNISSFNGLRWFGHVGLGLDYTFENNWLINVTAKTYINNSFFEEKPVLNAFNTGVISISAGVGYKFE